MKNTSVLGFALCAVTMIASTAHAASDADLLTSHPWECRASITQRKIAPWTHEVLSTVDPGMKQLTYVVFGRDGTWVAKVFAPGDGGRVREANSTGTWKLNGKQITQEIKIPKPPKGVTPFPKEITQLTASGLVMGGIMEVRSKEFDAKKLGYVETVFWRDFNCQPAQTR